MYRPWLLKIAEKNQSDDDPCWDGYEMVGFKTKNGRRVPNCVPKKIRKDDISVADLEQDGGKQQPEQGNLKRKKPDPTFCTRVHAEKANPYRDEQGRFTTAEGDADGAASGGSGSTVARDLRDLARMRWSSRPGEIASLQAATDAAIRYGGLTSAQARALHRVPSLMASSRGNLGQGIASALAEEGLDIDDWRDALNRAANRAEMETDKSRNTDSVYRQRIRSLVDAITSGGPLPSEMNSTSTVLSMARHFRQEGGPAATSTANMLELMVSSADSGEDPMRIFRGRGLLPEDRASMVNDLSAVAFGGSSGTLEVLRASVSGTSPSSGSQGTASNTTLSEAEHREGWQRRGGASINLSRAMSRDDDREFRVVWNGVGPGRYTEAIASVLPSGWSVEEKWYGGSGSQSVDLRLSDETGVEFGKISRSFYPREKEVKHELFDLTRDASGSYERSAGVGMSAIGAMFDTYRRMGVERVRVSAGLDNGPYTWARMGFEPNDRTWSRLASDIQNNALSLWGVDEANRIRQAMDRGGPRTLWTIAAMDQGRELLRGTSYDGVFRMGDRDQEAQLAAALSRARGRRQSAGKSDSKKLSIEDVLAPALAPHPGEAEAIARRTLSPEVYALLLKKGS